MGKICRHCGQPLHESQYADGETLKSCPKCSAEDGEEHIFYPYPGRFGQSEKRSSVSTPDGAQSWCTRCRGNWFGPHPDGKRCSEVN